MKTIQFTDEEINILFGAVMHQKVEAERNPHPNPVLNRQKKITKLAEKISNHL